MSFREFVQPEVSGASGTPIERAVYVGSFGRRAHGARHCSRAVTPVAVPGSLRQVGIARLAWVRAGGTQIS